MRASTRPKVGCHRGKLRLRDNRRSSHPHPTPLAGNWLCFSGSTPPWLVLSHNMPTINTPSKLASFCRFCNTVGSLPSDSLNTVLPPRLTLHTPRLTPHAPPAGSGCAQALPAGYCHPPTAESTRTERNPISTSCPSIFSMSQKFAHFLSKTLLGACPSIRLCSRIAPGFRWALAFSATAPAL